MRAREVSLGLLLFAVGCLVPRYEAEPAEASAAGSSGKAGASSTGAMAGATSAGSSNPTAGSSGSETCTSKQKRCAGACVEIDDPTYGCTPTSCDMAACPAAGEGTLACEDSTCVLGSCGPGDKKCDGKCVAINDPTYGCSETDCDGSVCPDPGSGTVLCKAGKCELGTCSADMKACDGKCVPPNRDNGCEDPFSCTACKPIEVCGYLDGSGCICSHDDPCVALECGEAKDRCGMDVTCQNKCDSNEMCVDHKCVQCRTVDDCPQVGNNVCAEARCIDNVCSFVTKATKTACPGGGTCSSTVPGLCERPTVTVTGSGYNIDATEVTRGQYARFVAEAEGDFSKLPAACAYKDTFIENFYFEFPPAVAEMDLPITFVDWCDAYGYCAHQGRRLCGKIGGGSNPTADRNDNTKSQWMRACTGGAKNYKFPYGNTVMVGACHDSYAGPNELIDVASRSSCVGGFAGLYDMSGSVFEWEDSCEANSGADDYCRWRGGDYSLAYMAAIDLACDNDQSVRRKQKHPTTGFRCCSN